MKKISIRILCIAIVFTLIACGKDNKTVDINQHDEPTMHENKFKFSVPTLQDFVDRISQKPIVSSDTNTVLVQAAANDNLIFDEYPVLVVFYAPAMIDGEATDDRVVLDVYWHEKDCDSDSLATCREKFRLHLLYFKEGIRKVAVTEGYTQTDDPNFYTKTVNGKTLYVYIMNDQYYCRFVIDDELVDHTSISNQLYEFCADVQKFIEN